MTLADLNLSPLVLRLLAFAWGAVWGSFINVVVYRVPRDLSVVRPGSHCPACGKPIAAFDNVPVVSWLVLRGHARCCGAAISPRYPLVEAVSGLIALAVLETGILPLSQGTPLPHATTLFLSDFGLAMGLLAASLIDLEHMYLPDSITIGGTLLGLATPGMRGLTWTDGLVGAAVGFLGVWLPLIVGYRALRGREGMGMGDAKLTMLAGAWFGWPGVVFAIFGGAIHATLAAFVVLAVRGKIEEPESVLNDRRELQAAAAAGDEEAQRILDADPLLGAPPPTGFMTARMPFGPFLCLAIVEWMLVGPWIADRWLAWLTIA